MVVETLVLPALDRAVIAFNPPLAGMVVETQRIPSKPYLKKVFQPTPSWDGC